MIALDAMGGDRAPRVTVRGAVRAARAGCEIGLFGDEVAMRRELDVYDNSWSDLPIRLFHCSEHIGMDEDPARAVARKKDASLVRALQAVVDGQASAVVTAGNSGAALVAGVLLSKRVEGLLRPALGSYVPTERGEMFCLDLGANADCKPEYLVHFALMGAVFVGQERGIDNPRIGLLSNGHEPYKGSLVVKKAYELLNNSALNFVGNIEARDVFDGTVDVLVTDGFSGNIFIKTAQGMAKAVARLIDRTAQLSFLRRIFIAPLANQVVRWLYAKNRHSDKPAALLLGLQHPVLVAHGCASEFGVEASLRKAKTIVMRDSVRVFNEKIAELLPTFAQPVGVASRLRSLLRFGKK